MSNSDRRGLAFWIYAWWPVVLGVVVIALESTEMMGSNHTSGPLRWVYQLICGPVSDVRWETIHLVIRKTGHFIGYGCIGLAWLRAWWLTLPHSSFFPDALLALAGTALVASADETHQTFLPNRSGSIHDVFLDCCGAITLQLIVYLSMRIFRPKRLVRAI